MLLRKTGSPNTRGLRLSCSDVRFIASAQNRFPEYQGITTWPTSRNCRVLAQNRFPEYQGITTARAAEAFCKAAAKPVPRIPGDYDVKNVLCHFSISRKTGSPNTRGLRRHFACKRLGMCRKTGSPNTRGLRPEVKPVKATRTRKTGSPNTRGLRPSKRIEISINDCYLPFGHFAIHSLSAVTDQRGLRPNIIVGGGKGGKLEKSP